MTSHDAPSQKCKPCCRSVVACLLQLLLLLWFLLSFLFVVLLLQLLLPLHVMLCVCSSFFFSHAQRCLLIVVLLLQLPLPLHVMPVVFVLPFFFWHFSRCCSICESVNLVALALFHGGTPILTQTWFSHLNAYAFTCAQHPKEYPNQAGRWRSLSNSAIQSEVQLAGTCA